MRSGRLEFARLEGERVVLRPVRAVDSEGLFPQIYRRDSVLRWLIWPGPESVDDLARRFADWRLPGDEQDPYVFAIRDRESRALCGTVGVRLSRDGREADLGYWLGEVHWGRGLATEAVGLACWLVFMHLEVRRAVATVFVGNDGSRTVLERNGFELEETLRDVRIGLGRTVDQWFYALERSRWEGRACEPRREQVAFRRP